MDLVGKTYQFSGYIFFGQNLAKKATMQFGRSTNFEKKSLQKMKNEKNNIIFILYQQVVI